MFVCAIALAVVGASGACGSAASDDGAADRPLHVFAAASLTEVLGELEPTFEAKHPDVDVRLTFAGSSALVRQVLDGADADVVITADERTMQQLVDASAVGPRVVVARNRLAILVEAGNPKSITGIGDLARRDLKVVLCAEQVPCGALARDALDTAGVSVQPASLEENVKGVVAKVSLGEADAGVAYETDGKAAGAAVEVVALGPGAGAAETDYPAAVVSASKARAAAESLIEFLGSAAARDALGAAGFRMPS